MNEMVMQYEPGDIVRPVAVEDHGFIGVVRDVDARINKVTVAWGGGSMKQHDPDELMLCIHQDPTVRERMGSVSEKVGAGFFVDRASSEGAGARDSKTAAGMEDSVMRARAKETAENAFDGVKEEADELARDYADRNAMGGPKDKLAKAYYKAVMEEVAKLAGRSKMASAARESRRGRSAAYWCAPQRTYRMTRSEQESGAPTCPRCKVDMAKEPFTRSEKMWVCPTCRFKVPAGKLTTTRVTVDVDRDGEVEVDVTNASRRTRSAAVSPEDLAALPRMGLDEIARVVYQDWRPVSYAAKPYVEALSSLRDVKDSYMNDSGSSIVAYFLSNANAWKGEVAKAVKSELKRRLKGAR